ncbi:MAG TPA: hypothetical protein VFQ05_08840 [Candidatus Eisenbacteria bacterium]|nr:hypothetical protein [Candidatus Eisenbacteria bacterium]
MSHDWRNPERVAPWKPRHRFRTTEAGVQAASRYREMMAAAQQAPDARTALDRAKQEWAASLNVRSGDGILLEDMAGGALSLAELQPTLEACDLSLREARGVLDRLIAAKLIEPLEPTGATTHERWSPPSY